VLLSRPGRAPESQSANPDASWPPKRACFENSPALAGSPIPAGPGRGRRRRC